MDHNGLIESPYVGNKRMIFITSNEGYEAMLDCRQILTDKLGLVLKNEFGMTDMTQEYLYNNKSYFLNYVGIMDMIIFVSEIKNDSELKEYRDLAKMLINERKSKLNKGSNIK